MDNFVTASVEFYFKGEKIFASIELDLNTHTLQSDALPHIYLKLAQSVSIGIHSYEFEMMQAETILFSNAKGMVADHVTDGRLDINAFFCARQQHCSIEKLSLIAKNNMAIEDLATQPGLKQALLDAYQLGLNEAAHKD